MLETEKSKIRIVSASEIARSRFPLKEKDERKCILGKAFEQAYCYVSYKIDGIIDLSEIHSEIIEQQSKRLGYKYDANNKKIDEQLMNDEITCCSICDECWNIDDVCLCTFNKEYDWMCMDCMLKKMKKILIEKAEEITKLTEEEKMRFLGIFNLFLNENICGTIPPTKAKRCGEWIITAKPDLWDAHSQEELIYNEFKICLINDYAREQVKIFAWVVNHSINLYGISQDFKLQKETIFPPDTIGEIPDTIGELYNNEEICPYCNLSNCNCKPVYDICEGDDYEE